MHVIRGLIRRRAATVAVASLCVALLACGDDDGEAAQATPSPTISQNTPTGSPSPADPSGADLEPVVTGAIATNLSTPWGIAFLPDGDALVADRDNGEIVRVSPDGQVRRVGSVPGVVYGGEGGLLGLAVAPDFAEVPHVYAYFTSESDNRIVRMRFDGDGLGRPEVLVDGIPRAGNHNGGRLAFGPDGMLYATTGDASQQANAQNRDSLAGKILRMTPDGEVPPGNPFGSLVWSYGHRNPQGIAWDDQDRLWAAEFGQNTWDELNLIEPGGNYGWPEVEGQGGQPDFIDPLVQWSPDEASPSGIAIFRGSVFMAALAGDRLWQIPLTDGGVGQPRDHFAGEYGRLRTIVVAPDGSLWLTTSNTDGRGSPAEDDDKILRLELRPRS